MFIIVCALDESVLTKSSVLGAFALTFCTKNMALP